MVRGAVRVSVSVSGQLSTVQQAQKWRRKVGGLCGIDEIVHLLFFLRALHAQ